MILRDPPHYLSGLKRTTVPDRLLWLDCVASADEQQGVTVERWLCGALGSTHHTSKRGDRRDGMEVFDSPADIWARADAFCRPGRRVVLWAHDLAFQLRVSQALVHLPALGWKLRKIVLERTAAWAELRDGNRTLLCCDLKSWAPADLARIAGELGPGAGGLVAAASAVTSAHEIAWKRAAVVRDAVMLILGWVKTEGLGTFRPTGSGQSYSAFRRRFMAHKILVHDQLDVLEAERRAMWTGRCEAWHHGVLRGGPFLELDMFAAHCQIAADCELPTTLVGRVQTKSLDKLCEVARTDCVLADVTVTVSDPIVPMLLGERTCWPVGTFRTVLWDPELGLLRAAGAAVTVNRAWRYKRAPILRDFARFVLDGIQSAGGDHGPLIARVLKHWSRTLIGRFGLRYRAWERFGTQPVADLRLVTFVDLEAGSGTDMLIAGHDRLILAELTEAIDSLPQIPGWVMSECRRRLWLAMLEVGLDQVLYVDTDSIIVRSSAPSESLASVVLATEADWAIKGTCSQMTIHGPRNLTVQDARRTSGVPLSARQVAPLEFSGQVMRSIKESMRAGELDQVVSIPRKFVLDAPDMRRDHIPGGLTAPYSVEVPCS